MAVLVESVEIDAPAEQVWDFLVDWERQGEWMLGTRVRPTAAGGQGVGGGIEGFTGVGPVGLRDPMVIRVWEPPTRVVMRHLGPYVRGSGAFEIVALGPSRCRFVWSEWLQLPLGPLGKLGWLILGPLSRAGVRLSLRRLARRFAPA